MLRILGSPKKLCNGLTRRDWIRVGGLGLAGLTLPQLTALQQVSAGERGSIQIETPFPASARSARGWGKERSPTVLLSIRKEASGFQFCTSRAAKGSG